MLKAKSFGNSSAYSGTCSGDFQGPKGRKPTPNTFVKGVTLLFSHLNQSLFLSKAKKKPSTSEADLGAGREQRCEQQASVHTPTPSGAFGHNEILGVSPAESFPTGK